MTIPVLQCLIEPRPRCWTFRGTLNAGLHVSKLMSNGERSIQSRVLHNCTAPVWGAHCSKFGQTWGTKPDVPKFPISRDVTADKLVSDKQLNRAILLHTRQ